MVFLNKLVPVYIIYIYILVFADFPFDVEQVFLLDLISEN